MGQLWNRWVERIIDERESENPTDRRRGFVRQLLTELVVYTIVGVLVAIFGLLFDAFTPLVVFSNPRLEAPLLVGGITAVLFQTVWDNWLRETEDVTEDEEAEVIPEEPASEQTTLEDDSEAFR